MMKANMTYEQDKTAGKVTDLAKSIISKAKGLIPFKDVGKNVGQNAGRPAKEGLIEVASALDRSSHRVSNMRTKHKVKHTVSIDKGDLRDIQNKLKKMKAADIAKGVAATAAAVGVVNAGAAAGRNLGDRLTGGGQNKYGSDKSHFWNGFEKRAKNWRVHPSGRYVRRALGAVLGGGSLLGLAASQTGKSDERYSDSPNDIKVKRDRRMLSAMSGVPLGVTGTVVGATLAALAGPTRKVDRLGNLLALSAGGVAGGLAGGLAGRGAGHLISRFGGQATDAEKQYLAEAEAHNDDPEWY